MLMKTSNFESTYMAIMEQCIPKRVFAQKKELPSLNAGITHAIKVISNTSQGTLLISVI